MTQVLHLIGHDLRTHRRLLIAWLVVVLAQPLASLLAGPALSSTGILVPFVLIACRLLLAAVALGTIVQADSPLDDRTFWRTRPVAARTMATAKLAIGAIVVTVPLVVVLLVAVVVRVPISHLPSTIAQVVVTDAAAVGFALLLASATRSIASALIAMLGTMSVSYVLLIATTETLRSSWLQKFFGALVDTASTHLAVPTMLILVVVAVWALTMMVFLGHRHRLRRLLAGAAAVLALVVVWFVPGARLHQARPRFERRPSLVVASGPIRAERLASGRIALLATGTLSGVQSGDRSRQYLIDGTLDTDDGPLVARHPADPRFVTGGLGPHPVLLGGLSDAQFTRLAGRPVRFRGRVGIEVARTEVVGTMPLIAGASLDLENMRLRVREVRPEAQVRPTFVSLATVDVTWIATWTEGSRVAATQWRLRNGADRHDVFRFMQTPFVGYGLLPSLAWPFGVDRSVLYVPQSGGTAIAGPSSLELEAHRGTMQTELPLRVDFVAPTTVAPHNRAPQSP